MPSLSPSNHHPRTGGGGGGGTDRRLCGCAHWMDGTCLIAALLFIGSNLASAVFFGNMRHERQQHHNNITDLSNTTNTGSSTTSSTTYHFDYNAMRELNPMFVQDSWEFRLQHQALENTANLLNAAAWLFLALPMVRVSWMLMQAHNSNLNQYNHHRVGGGGDGDNYNRNSGTLLALHVSIVILTLGGSFMELVSSLLWMGFQHATEWLARDFNLSHWIATNTTTTNTAGLNDNEDADNIGWRVLEVVYMSVRGILLWIDSFEWLALSVVLPMLFVSVWALPASSQHQQRRLFRMGWAWFGLLVAAVSLLTFIFELLRFQNWHKYGSVAYSLSAALGLALLPIWLLWLGCQLPAAQFQLQQEQAAAMVQERVALTTKMATTTTTTKGADDPTGNDDDDDDDGGEDSTSFT